MTVSISGNLNGGTGSVFRFDVLVVERGWPPDYPGEAFGLQLRAQTIRILTHVPDSGRGVPIFLSC